MEREEFLNNMKLSIDNESVNIYVEQGEDKDPIHVCYWHIDEVEEDSSVMASIANAIDLYYRDREELINRLANIEGYIYYRDDCSL